MALPPILYGDGIHDDAPAIQHRIDSGICELILPPPEKFYLIGSTLVLPSHFRLVLPRFAEIRLADGANCLMVRNRMTPDFAERLPADLSPMCRHLWYYVNDYSPDAIEENIEICGGIWNCNNKNQLPNPEQTKRLEPYGYTGEGMLFYGVRHLKLSSLTLKDPVHWGISLDRVSYFTAEDLEFDYNLGNPYAINMDGLHINGNCRHGIIRNLRGACYDDMVALNAHEGSRGPIEHIDIDGLFAEGCHSAVRLLTVHDPIRYIRIANVHGTFYQYCVGLTKYYPGETTGEFDCIRLEHIHASKASREGIYPWPDSYVFPLLYLQDNTHIRHISVSDLFRREEINPVETVYIGTNTEIDTIILDTVVTENRTEKPMPLLVNRGKVEKLVIQNVRER